MNEPELFNVPVVKSPRLKWLARHGISTLRADHTVSAGEEDDFGHRVHQWTATNGWHNRGGDTEDDALAALARVALLKMWNEEGL
jgi:hypothetical protein